MILFIISYNATVVSTNNTVYCKAESLIRTQIIQIQIYVYEILY